MKWISFTCTYIPSLLDLPPTCPPSHPSRLSQRWASCVTSWLNQEKSSWVGLTQSGEPSKRVWRRDWRIGNTLGLVFYMLAMLLSQDLSSPGPWQWKKCGILTIRPSGSSLGLVSHKLLWRGPQGGEHRARVEDSQSYNHKNLNAGNNQGVWQRTPKPQMGSLVAQLTDTLISTWSNPELRTWLASAQTWPRETMG